jgi:hypothetical protein
MRNRDRNELDAAILAVALTIIIAGLIVLAYKR